MDSLQSLDRRKGALGKVIAFVSGKGGAGKSIIVSNLGAILAKQKYKTVLVDCDFFTRGLTFYIMKQESTEVGILEYLTGEKALQSLIKGIVGPIGHYEFLYMLPASGRPDLFSLTDMDKMVFRQLPAPGKEGSKLNVDYLVGLYERMNMLIRELKKRFDYVLIDTRSGADPISLLPAIVSDEYVLVTEEDKTSWRIGPLLIREMEELSVRIEHSLVGRRVVMIGGPNLGGFILNKETEEPAEEIVGGFLERRLFGGPCLVQIPLERRVPLAFKEDELVIDRYPHSIFSRKMRVLADVIKDLVSKEERQQRQTIGDLVAHNYVEIAISLLSTLTAFMVSSFAYPLGWPFGLLLSFLTVLSFIPLVRNLLVWRLRRVRASQKERLPDAGVRLAPQFDHLEAWLFYDQDISYEDGERDPKKNNPRNKLICNTRTKKAFYVDDVVWRMIRQGKIRWHSDDDQNLEQWCKRTGYKLENRDARMSDLLAGAFKASDMRE